MSKITYLIGAGASVGALPIVNQIPERIQKLIEFLEKEEFMLEDTSTYDDLNRRINSPKSKRKYQQEMIASLKWMMEKSANHASIDTFAKKLYIKYSREELKKLKVAMSVFFVFEQARHAVDIRYDAFFASILDGVNSFPDNIKILSWNYDYQFELAYAEYSGQSGISNNKYNLRVASKYDRNARSTTGFEILKLNGTTEISDRWDSYIYANDLKVDIDKDFISQITKQYAVAMYIPDLYSSLSFAWEEEDSEKSIIQKAINTTQDTTALVVIGYSFPFFNRNIDKKIINSMKSLKRVYFQAPDANDLKERFQALRNDLSGVDLVTRFDIKQFLLPNEL